MGAPQDRFKAGTGQRYLKDGRIRCHAISKGQLHKWREEFDDWKTPSEDTWPETQCIKGAAEGYHVCRWHGAKTPRLVSPPRTILDTMPEDLSAKLKILLDNPDYISRKEDILLIKARQWELLEQLQSEYGGEEAWGMVAEGLHQLEMGEDFNGMDLIRQALDSNRNTREIWDEIYRSEGVVKDLTNTQVKTAKELRLMATNEQVTNMIASIYDIMLETGERFIDDPIIRDQYIKSLAGSIGRLVKPNSAILIEQTSTVGQ